MEEVLKEYAIKALEWLESGAMWVANEIPVYIEEIVKWNMARNVIFIAVYTLIIAAILIVFLKNIKPFKDGDFSYDAEIGFIVFMIFGGCGVAGFFSGLVYHTLNVVQILVAPRVFLIEYLSGLLS